MDRNRSACRIFAVLFLLGSHWSASAAEITWQHLHGFNLLGLRGLKVAKLSDAEASDVVVSGISASLGSLVGIAGMGPDGLMLKQIYRLPAHASISGEIQVARSAIGQDHIYLVEEYGQFSRALVTLGGHPLRQLAKVPLEHGLWLTGVADISGDGRLQALGTRNSVPAIVDVETGLRTWEGGQLVGSWVRAGKLGNAPAMAIIIGNLNHTNEPGTILDGASLQPRWVWPGPFSGDIRFGRFTDPDNHQFAVVGTHGFTTVFTALPFHSPLHDFAILSPQASASADIDGDGLDELIVGQDQWGKVKVHSGVDGSLLWELSHPGHGIPALDVGPAGPGGEMAVAFASGSGGSGSSSLRVATFDDGLVQSIDAGENGPHSSALLADLGGAGQMELVRAVLDQTSGSRGRRLSVLDPRTGEEVRGRLIEQTSSPHTPGGAVMAVGQFDSDPQSEIVLAYAESSWRPIRLLDGLTLETQWERHSQEAVTHLAVHDVNEDGIDDVIALIGRALVILDGSDGSDIWTSAQMASGNSTNRSLLVDTCSAGARATVTLGNLLHEVDISSREVVHSYPLLYHPPEGGEWPVQVIGQSVANGSGGCLHLIHGANQTGSRAFGSSEITWRNHGVSAEFVRSLPDLHAEASPLHAPLILSDGRALWLDVPEQPPRLLLEGLGPSLGWENRGELTTQGTKAQLFIGDDVGFYSVRFDPALLFESGFEAP